MRLLVITAAYPGPTEPHRGGFVESLCRGLVECGHEIRVLCPRIHGRDPDREIRHGIPIHRFPFLSPGHILKSGGIDPLRGTSYLAAGSLHARRIARRFQPDAVLAHWALPAGPLGVVAARSAGAPLLIHVHGTDLRDLPDKGPQWRHVIRTVLIHASGVVCVSNDLAERVREVSPTTPAKIVTAPCGVDLSIFKPRDRGAACRELGLPESKRRVLFVGDLIPQKGPQRLMSAANALVEDHPDVSFVIVGAGPLSGHLKKSNHFHVTGPQPHKEIATWMAACDVLALPSDGEGLPLVVSEALATGLPVVATRTGGLPDLSKRFSTGLTLIDSPDVVSLKAALHQALSAPQPVDFTHRESLNQNYAVQATDSLIQHITSDSGTYDRFWKTTAIGRRDLRTTQRADLAADLLANRKATGERLLDAGCGRGLAGTRLAKFGYDVFGIDVSKEAVRQARGKAMDAHPFDLEQDTLSEKYDVILCLEVLEHVTNPDDVIGKLACALDPGGDLVLSVPETYGNWNPLHRHDFSPKQAEETFQRAGLRVLESRPVPAWPPWLAGSEMIGRPLARLAGGPFKISTMYRLRKAD